jgi:hypothetical protein
MPSYSGIWSLEAQFQAKGLNNWPAPAPDGIGAAYGGGYYAGKINDSGVDYYLIIAPKSSGENSSIRWKTSNTSTSGTSSVINGPANSSAMNNATHPAAEFCEGLTIGGFSDWYMPAKNELEVCYHNLKPTTNNNYAGQGANPNAVPPTDNYTIGDPARTSVAIFQSGGAEVFSTSFYLSSTEYSAEAAWTIEFLDGTQGNSNKTNFRYVRAVRRVRV